MKTTDRISTNTSSIQVIVKGAIMIILLYVILFT